MVIKKFFQSDMNILQIAKGIQINSGNARCAIQKYSGRHNRVPASANFQMRKMLCGVVFSEILIMIGTVNQTVFKIFISQMHSFCNVLLEEEINPAAERKK